MKITRTTPPRPLDVITLFPQLTPLARTATRLHPVPASPSSRNSSVGGPLLWPADEPWPHCDGPHEWDGTNPLRSLADLRLERWIQATAQGRDLTPQERETLARVNPPRTYPRPTPSRQPHEGSIALLPLAQLYARDVPDLPAPAGTDLLQVLWCPFDHPPKCYMPKTVLFWRSAAEVTNVLTAPPEPPAVQFRDYLPEPCLLLPEQITEFPNPLELSRELRGLLEDWSRWEAAGDTVDSRYALYPSEFYSINLSVAPGWKVGGWASWGLTDPIPQCCLACGTAMNPLLTIATGEWDSSDHSWIPYEMQQSTAPTRGDRPRPNHPTAIQIGRGYKQQLYVCPVSPEHPHTELMQ